MGQAEELGDGSISFEFDNFKRYGYLNASKMRHEWSPLGKYLKRVE